MLRFILTLLVTAKPFLCQGDTESLFKSVTFYKLLPIIGILTMLTQPMLLNQIFI